MKPPLHLSYNALGLLVDLRDADDHLVSCGIDEAEARRLLDRANGHANLVAELAAAREEAEDLRRFLRRFRNTTEWHTERRKLMRKAEE